MKGFSSANWIIHLNVIKQLFVTSHLLESLSYQIESYRIMIIEYLSNKNESYRIRIENN